MRLSLTSCRLFFVCFVLYLLCELWRLRRFRRLLQRLRVRQLSGHAGGGRNFLAFVKAILVTQRAPLSHDAEVFQRYAKEPHSDAVGYGGGPLDWRRLYAWWAWGAGRPNDSSRDPELHADLLECAGASCRALGLEPPPTAAAAPEPPSLPPFGFGVNEVRATFKPLPLRAFLRGMLLTCRVALRTLGFRRITEPMPEGDLVCWTDLPPVVFLHGLGLGVMTYLPLFVGKGSREWRAGGCVIVELPCMSSSMTDLERLPKAVHYADALARILRKRLGCGDFEFDVVCHSLSAYLAAILCNEGSPCRPRRTVLMDPVCFLEGVEVCSRFPFRTPEECRTFAEATVLFPRFLPMRVRRLLGVIFRHLVCRDIFTQYTVLRWNCPDATCNLWRSASADALVCLSDEDHFVPSQRVALHCETHFPRMRLYHMPKKDHGSFIIESDLRQELMDRITAFLDYGR